jgi:hypothetical protein
MYLLFVFYCNFAKDLNTKNYEITDIFVSYRQQAMNVAATFHLFFLIL